MVFSKNYRMFKKACANFKYKADTDGATTLEENLKSLVISDISSPFEGDCEDFAFSLQKVIGGQVWYTILPDEGAHAVLVKSGVVYDFYKGRHKIKKYPSRLLFWFDENNNHGTDFKD